MSFPHISFPSVPRAMGTQTIAVEVDARFMGGRQAALVAASFASGAAATLLRSQATTSRAGSYKQRGGYRKHGVFHGCRILHEADGC